MSGGNGLKAQRIEALTYLVKMPGPYRVMGRMQFPLVGGQRERSLRYAMYKTTTKTKNRSPVRPIISRRIVLSFT
jgi:hypothetical protein